MHAGVLPGRVSACSSPSRLVLKGSLLWAHERLRLSLLADSDADDSFVDERLSRQVGLPLVELAEPK